MFPKIVFVVLIVIFVILYHRRRPDFPLACYLLLVSVYFSRIYWEVVGSTVRLEQISCLLLFITLVFDIWKKKLEPHLNIRAFLMLFLFPLMVLSSLLGTRYSILSLKKTLIYVPYLLAFLALVLYLQKKEDLLKAWDFIYSAGGIALGISMAGYYLFVAGVDLGMVRVEWGTFSLRGTMIIPNILGSTAVVIFIAALMRLISKNEQREKIGFDMAAMVVAISCIMMSLTRTAWICGVLGILLSLMFSAKRLAFKKTLLSLVVMAVTLGLTYLTTTHLKPRLIDVTKEMNLGEFGERNMDSYWIPQKTDRIDYSGKIKETAKIKEALKDNRPFEKTLADNPNYITIQRRITTSKAALKDWRSSPVIGKGTDSFLIENNQRPEYYISSTGLTILHDWGIIGFLLYGIFLIAVFLGIFKIFLKTTQLSVKVFSSTLIVIMILFSIMYELATTMQLSIFWVLLAFFSSAASARFAPASSQPGQSERSSV